MSFSSHNAKLFIFKFVDLPLQFSMSTNYKANRRQYKWNSWAGCFIEEYVGQFGYQIIHHLLRLLGPYHRQEFHRLFLVALFPRFLLTVRTGSDDRPDHNRY